jgi:hypothetical protein
MCSNPISFPEFVISSAHQSFTALQQLTDIFNGGRIGCVRLLEHKYVGLLLEQATHPRWTTISHPFERTTYV